MLEKGDEVCLTLPKLDSYVGLFLNMTLGSKVLLAPMSTSPIKSAPLFELSITIAVEFLLSLMSLDENIAL